MLSNLYVTLIVNFAVFPPAFITNLQMPLFIPRIRSNIIAHLLDEAGDTQPETPATPAKEDPETLSADAIVMDLLTPTVGVPVTMTFTLVVLVFGFLIFFVAFGVTATLNLQVPGFKAVILVPCTEQTVLEFLSTVSVILAPLGIATFATLFTEANEIFFPVSVFAIFLTVEFLGVHETPFTTTQKLCEASAPLPRMR